MIMLADSFKIVMSDLSRFIGRHYIILLFLCGILFYIHSVITAPLEVYEYASKTLVDNAIWSGSFSSVSTGRGYDMLISAISLVSGLDTLYFNLIPAGMLLYYSTFLAIFLRLSKNKFLSFFGIMLMFFAHSVTPDLYIHQIGFGLIFNYALLLCAENISYKLKIIFGSMLIIPIYFISYNASALYELLFISLIVIYLSLLYICRRVNKSSQQRNLLIRKIILLFIPVTVGAITIFGLSNFIYERYLNHILRSGVADYTLTSKLYDLIFHWIIGSDNVSTSIISEYHYHSSQIASYMTYVSYFMMGLIIIIYLLFVLSQIRSRQMKLLTKFDVIIVALIFTSSMFLVIRLLNNDLSFSLYTNTIFIIAIRMLTISKPKMRLITSVIVIIVAFSLTSGIAYATDDEKYYGNSYYPAFIDSSIWTITYLPEYCAVYSDVGSVGYIKHIAWKYFQIVAFRGALIDYASILDIANNSPNATDTYERCVLLNYIYNRMSISMTTWELIENWHLINKNVNFNMNYNALYSNGMLNFLKTTAFPVGVPSVMT